MKGSMATRAKKSSEKDIYRPKQTLLHMPEKSKSHSESSKVDFKKAGDAIAKKKGIMTKKEGSTEVSKEEVILLNKAIKAEMAEVESGKQKVYSSDEIDKDFGL